MARLVEQLDDDRYEAFAERAGILEYDARMSRVEAELHALIQTLARYGYPGCPKVHLLHTLIRGRSAFFLAGNAVTARQRLAAMGGVEIVEVDLAQTLRLQFVDLAQLTMVG